MGTRKPAASALMPFDASKSLVDQLVDPQSGIRSEVIALIDRALAHASDLPPSFGVCCVKLADMMDLVCVRGIRRLTDPQIAAFLRMRTQLQSVDIQLGRASAKVDNPLPQGELDALARMRQQVSLSMAK